MKHVSRFLALFSLFAILAVSAFASGPEKKKNITLDQPAQIAGTQLKPGTYQLKWQDSGTGTTNVTVYQGKEAVVTVPAQIVNQKKANSNADFEFNTANGGYRLDRVYLSNQILELGNSA